MRTRLSPPVDRERLTALGLEGHRQAPIDAAFAASIEQALAALERLVPERAEMVLARIEGIVHVELEDGSRSGLSSTTFYDLRGVAFLTPNALRFVPPGVVFQEPCAHALADNLAHEALHQELMAAIDRVEHVKPPEVGRMPVSIRPSWRGAEWGIEQVLQAAYVYTRLGPFRSAAAVDGSLPSDARAAFGEATRSGGLCADELIAGLRAHGARLTERGRKLVEQLANERAAG